MKKLSIILLLAIISISTFAQTHTGGKHHKKSMHNARKYGVHCSNYLSVIG